jgi:phospholipase/carboxylesterase
MQINSSTQHLGPLKCRTIDALANDSAPELLVVLNHGFGASGDDLADFGPMLIDSSPVVQSCCRFIFPEAPVDLSPMGMPGGRAWWPINMAKLAEINQTRDYDQLMLLEPPGMKEAEEMLNETLKAAMAISGLEESRVIVGGFSQGAMVSTNLVLTRNLRPALMALFSGTLLNRNHWQKLAKSHGGCDVLQSHGRQDFVLPFAPAVELKDMLAAAGFNVEFIEFNGPHTIPMNVLQRFLLRIEQCIERNRLVG